MKNIPHNKASISDNDINAVVNSLRSNWLAQGKYVERFEKAVCEYLGSKKNSLQGVAVSSGTAALYLALIGLSVKPQDEVIVPTYTCSAVLNAINLIGAVPVLVDIDSISWNISYESTVSAITRRTKAIIITHTFGVPTQIEPFIQLGVPIIEDCAQAIGATIGKKKVGTFGDASIFSFYATKMMTTGYGGMVVSSNKKMMKKIEDYREFDCRRSYYPRFNFQMSDFQAALGLSQIKKLDEFISVRRSLSEKYKDAVCANADVDWQRPFKESKPNYYRFVLKLGRDCLKLKNAMKKAGIQCPRPIKSHELLHRYLRRNLKHFPVAEEIAKRSLSIPVFPGLAQVQIDRIVKTLSSQQTWRKT